jgi:hypothetical protein
MVASTCSESRNEYDSLKLSGPDPPREVRARKSRAIRLSGPAPKISTRSEPELANGPQPLKTGVLGPRDALPGQLRPLNQARTGKAA